MGEIETSQLSEVVSDLGITLTAKYDGRSAEPGYDDHETDNWTVTLHLGNRSLTTKFHMGTGLGRAKPPVTDVLQSLITDADCGEKSFEEFCGDFGYDEDSRKAEKIWKACKKIAPKIRKFLGKDYRAVAEAAAEY